MSHSDLLQRTRRTAAVNGGSIAIVAGLSAIISVLLGSGFGFVVGLAFAATGVMELRGRSLLVREAKHAGRWLLGAQLAFFVLIAAYAGYQLVTLTGTAIMQALSPETLKSIKQLFEMLPGIQLPGEDIGDTLLRNMRLVYWVLIVVSFFYQGAMAWYYRRQIVILQRVETND